jgi:nitrite reductase/ring-hydroxylating ferredoxin subunit
MSKPSREVTKEEATQVRGIHLLPWGISSSASQVGRGYNTSHFQRRRGLPSLSSWLEENRTVRCRMHSPEPWMIHTTGTWYMYWTLHGSLYYHSWKITWIQTLFEILYCYQTTYYVYRDKCSSQPRSVKESHQVSRTLVTCSWMWVK